MEAGECEGRALHGRGLCGDLAYVLGQVREECEEEVVSLPPWVLSPATMRLLLLCLLSQLINQMETGNRA